MTVITISRELGSGGDEIADIVCERLGYPRVDKDVLMEIAEEAGVDVDAVQRLESSFTKRARLVSGEMTSLYRKQASAFDQPGAIDDRTYAQVLKETLTSFAGRDDVVIVGRGGQMVLRVWPGALHVCLSAPPETRAERIVQREALSAQQALRLVERSDEQKRQYIRHMHNNADWRNFKYYHLMIDTSRVSAATAAAMIVLAARA